MIDHGPFPEGARVARRVHRRILGLTTTLMLALLTTMVNAEWYWQSPWPYTYTAYDMHMFDAEHVLVFGARAHMLRTTDGGLTWTLEYPELPAPAQGGGFGSVDFLDETTAMAVTVIGDITNTAEMVGFVLKTTDAGASWQTQLEMPATLMPDIAFADEQTAIAVGVDFLTGDTVLTRTTDGGESWNNADTGLNGVIINGVTFLDETVAVAVGYDLFADRGSILHTTDAGETWTVVEDVPAPGRLNDVAFLNASYGVAVGDSGIIVTSDDGGETWSAGDSGTQRHLHRATYADADRIVAVGGTTNEEGVIVESSDGGESWSTNEGGWRLESVFFYDTDNGMAVGSRGELVKTEDGGASWQNLNRRLNGRGFNDVSFPSPAVGTAVGNGGIIFRTVDGGNHWFSLDSGVTLPLSGVSFSDENHGVAVGGDISENLTPVIVKTDDGGETWVERTPEELPQLPYHSVSCIDGDTCVASAHCGMIVGTADGGESWELQRAPDCNSQPHLNGISLHESGSGTAIGHFTILTTADGGGTWISRASPDDPDNRPTDQVLRGVVQIDAQTATIVGGHQGDRGTILRLTGGGESWTLQRDEGSPLYAVDFHDAMNGVATSLGGTIHQTNDGGETWDTRYAPGNLYGVALTGPASGIAVGYNAGSVIHATFGGPTFPLKLEPDRAVICQPQGGTEEIPVQLTVNSVHGYQGSVDLASAEPPGVSSELDAATVAAPAALQWTISIQPAIGDGVHFVDLLGEDGQHSQPASFRLDVIDPGQVPSAVVPADGQVDVELVPDFSWSRITAVSEYQFQLAADSQFSDVVFETDVTGTELSSGVKLELDTEYFWRVRALESCADGWSEPFVFTTIGQPVAQVAPASLEFELPAGSHDTTVLTIGNTGIGTLDWEIDTADWPAVTPPQHQAAHDYGRFDTEVLDLVTLHGSPSGYDVLHAIGRGGAVGCADAPGLIVHDNGIIDNGYGAEPDLTDQVVFVDRFTPSAYPSLLTGVCLAFVTAGPDTLDVQVVIFDDDGTDGGPGTKLGAVPVTLEDIPVWPNTAPIWTEIDIAELGISVDIGSVYIGARWAPADPGAFIAADESPDNPVGFAGGYWQTEGNDRWAPLDGEFPAYRSLFVRAVENPGGCYAPSQVLWLDIAPAAGSTAEDEQSEVEITVDTTGLAPGDYRTNLCLNSNDPEQPLLVVPLAVTVTPPTSDAIFGDRFEPGGR